MYPKVVGKEIRIKIGNKNENGGRKGLNVKSEIMKYLFIYPFIYSWLRLLYIFLSYHSLTLQYNTLEFKFKFL